MRKCARKASVVILSVLIFAQIYGVYRIYSFAENIENNANVFSANCDQAHTGVKYNEKTRNEAERSAQNILGRGIKFRSSEFSGEENIIVCYTKNVYLELDTNSMHPMFFFYECQCGKAKLTIEECEKLVLTFVFRNMPRKAKAKDAHVYCGRFDDIAEFRIDFADGAVFAAIRRDTGSIVYYDASKFF